MDFVRWGMQRAQPRFQLDKLMIEAENLVKFEVGDGNATGHAEGKANGSIYRLDISEIDHPDARLIASAPELLDACESVMDAIAGHTDWHPDPEVDNDSWNEDAHIEITLTVADCRMLKRALAKAKGGRIGEKCRRELEMFRALESFVDQANAESIHPEPKS